MRKTRVINQGDPSHHLTMRFYLYNYGAYWGIKNVHNEQWLYVGAPKRDEDRHYLLTWGGSGNPSDYESMRFHLEKYSCGTDVCWGIQSLARNEWVYAGVYKLSPWR